MLIRDDIRENEPGIKTLVQMQVIDVATCNVVPQVTVDFWHCNTTGKARRIKLESSVLT